MCRVLEVSTSGYYAWRSRPASKRAREDAVLLRRIRTIHAASRETYGVPRVYKEFVENNESVGRDRIARLMRRACLRGVSPRRFVTTTRRNEATRPAPDLVERRFRAERPNQLWVADITYVPTWAGFLYLAMVLDVFSRKVVGWAISESLATPLVADALRRAIEARRPVGSGLLHHSDRGCQYTSDAYQKTLRTLGIECSMSRRGECYDNAVAERFFWSLKHEWTKHDSFADLEAARLSVFKYVETFYNSVRLHQSLGYKSPDKFETEYAPVLAA